MVSFTSFVVAATTFAGALALMPGAGNSTVLSPMRRAGTGNGSGNINGYYWQFWSNGGGTVNYQNTGAGSYSVQWSNVGDFTAGVGWNPGSSQSITFSGSYNPGSSGGSLAVYGWSENPLVEYYIMEDFPSPPTYGLTQVGTLTSDGSTYTFYKHQQVNQPSIVSSSSTFWQYISIRSSPRTSGTVTTGNHFSAWAKAGLNLGSMNYQILSTESYGGGSGSSSIKVSAGGSSSPTTTPTTTPVTTPTTSPTTSPVTTSPGSSPTGTCSAIYGQCGGSGWNGPTCCSSGTCQVGNPYYSQCL